MIVSKPLIHIRSNDLQTLCDCIIDDQISYVSMGILEGNKIFSAFSNPKWQETYVKENLHMYDPSFKTAINCPNVPILWTGVGMDTKKSSIIMSSRCEQTQVKNGLSISLRRNNRIVIVTLGTKENEACLMENFNTMVRKGLLVAGLCRMID